MSYIHRQWRLLITPSASGAWNMAVDEALLETVGSRQSLPCLRLFSWNPPCLSLGYAQPSMDVDHTRLADLGWDWVRRPTGGRAILHTDELTYSVIAPLDEPRVSGSVLESYQRLSSVLLKALNSLGVPAVVHPTKEIGNTPSTDPVCFEVPSNYEIMVFGKKLIGSAQARRKEGVLQHGSLPLWGDLSRITQVLAYPEQNQREEASQRLLAHATTLESVLGYKLDWNTLVQAFIASFRSELNLEFTQIELSTLETKRVTQLIQEKYSHPSWLKRI